MKDSKGSISGFDFMKMVQDSRVIPEVPSGGRPQKIIELLPAIKDGGNLKRDNPFVEDDIPDDKISVPMHYISFSKIFVLWRSWDGCTQCVTDIQAKKVALPDEGSYCCPHTDSVLYKRTVDECLRGDGVITLREAYTLKDGMRCMHMEWLQADPDYLREMERQENLRKENQVYPPDLDKAFRIKK